MLLTPRQEDVLIVHSSDLHVDDGYTARAWGGDGNAPLAAVLEAAQAIKADIVLLTGDIFEHNRLNATILERTRDVLAAARLPVVMLPGNHDPLMRGSVWDRGALGHWNRKVQVEDGDVPARYSGSPDYAKTVNVIRLTSSDKVGISHVSVDCHSHGII